MLVVLVCQISLYAKTDYASLGIERKVLFTMYNNENLHLSDFDDEKHFTITTIYAIDSTSDGYNDYFYVYRYSFIVNGERKCEMTNADNFSNLYYDDFSKCIYEYVGPDGGVYVQDRDKSYGPYSKVLIKPRKYPHKGFEHYKPGQFEFWYDDEHFVHEDDGKIRKFSKRRHEYTSPNKKHKVLIADGNPLTAINIDGKNYDLTNTIETYWKINKYDGCRTVRFEFSKDSIGKDMRKTSEFYTTDCCIFDDGTCLYRIISIRGISTTNYDFYIKGDSTRLLAERITDHEIIDNCNDEEDYWGKCCKDHTYYEYYDRKSDSILRHEVKNNDEENKCENMLLLLDKTDKHHIILDIENKVGFVDEKRIDLDIVLPWSVKFNESKNAFQWVCLEGKDIIFYSYVLNK